MYARLRSGVLLTAVIALLLTLTVAVQAGYLTVEAGRMLEDGQDGELFYAVAFMKEGPDIEGYRFAVEGLPRKERTRIVWRLVNQRAERCQQDILEQLDKRFREGSVESFRSLEILNAVGIHATEEVIRELAARADVDRVIPDIPRPLWFAEQGPDVGNNELDELVWSVEMINAPEVWEQGFTGDSVLVGIIDSGVNYNHEDLADHMWDGGDEYPNHGYDFGDNDNDPMDQNGHGTHCSGSICGDGTGQYATGVAPDATLMALRVSLSIDESAQQTVWDAQDFALEHEVDVTSMSMGYIEGWNPDKTAWRQAYEVLDAAGITNIVAAGNERSTQPPNSCRTPGNVPSPWRNPDETGEGERGGVISVGATDDQDMYASFSSRGPCTWESVDDYEDWVYNNGADPGLIRPDIAAPGEDVLSCSMNGGYTTMSGTSMATPHIAGVCALLLSKNWELLPVHIDSILQISGLDLGNPGKDNDYGAGRIMCDSAIANAQFPIGILEGLVVDGNTGEPVENVHVSLPGTVYESLTDAHGWYQMDALMGTQAVEYNLPPYHVHVEESVEIISQDTTTVNVILQVGIFTADTESLVVTLDNEFTANEEFRITNNGNGGLTISMTPLPIIELDEFMDPVFALDASELTGDTRLNGAAYHNGIFYIAGSNMYINPNKIYMINEDGEYLGSYDQAGSDNPDASSTGMHDLAFGDDLLWGSDNNMIYGMDPTHGETVRSFEGPYTPNRAIAYDDYNDILYVADYMHNIVAMDPEDGEVLDEIDLYTRINGLGYLGPRQDGFTLWITCREDNLFGKLYKMNPTTGETVFVDTLATGNQEVYGFSFAEGFQGYYQIGFGISKVEGRDHLVGWEWDVQVPWVELDPPYMYLEPTEYNVIDAIFDGETLKNGTYTGYIKFEHDGFEPADSIFMRLIVDFDGVPGSEVDDGLPKEFALDQPYPNPFNESAIVQFALPKAAHVELIVFDILGRQVTTLQQGEMRPGYHNLHFDGAGLSSGVYFLRMKTDQGYQRTVKMMLLK